VGEKDTSKEREREREREEREEEIYTEEHARDSLHF